MRGFGYVSIEAFLPLMGVLAVIIAVLGYMRRTERHIYARTRMAYAGVEPHIEPPILGLEPKALAMTGQPAGIPADNIIATRSEDATGNVTASQMMDTATEPGVSRNMPQKPARAGFVWTHFRAARATSKPIPEVESPQNEVEIPQIKSPAGPGPEDKPGPPPSARSSSMLGEGRGLSIADKLGSDQQAVRFVGEHLRESVERGGSGMVDITQVAGQVTTIKVERVVGHGTKQVLLEETKTIPAIKIVDIVATLTNMRSIVKNGKTIVQGNVHKQIYYIGTDDLEHHLAEDIAFGDLVEVVPLDPAYPAREGMNQQDFSSIENVVWEFDPATGTLIEKVIVALNVKVTETQQLPVAIDPYGQWIKAQVVIGEGSKQKFIEERKAVPAVKITDIVARLTNMKAIVKNGKVIVQGTVHKQIFYVGTDDLVHHLAEDIDFSDLIEVPPLNPDFPVREGMNPQDHSIVENVVWEFNPATSELTQKIILLLSIKVTETEQIPVAIDPYGTWISTDLVIGHGSKQRLIEETKTIPAIKIVDVVARVVNVTSIVKNGKVIVQGAVEKQIFYVGTDDLIHHLPELLPFSEMVEVTPINPARPVVEGMQQQDHSYIENVVWEFDPATGSFTEKVIVRIDIKVTQREQIRVASGVVV